MFDDHEKHGREYSRTTLRHSNRLPLGSVSCGRKFETQWFWNP
jgi:hypothetical protein